MSATTLGAALASRTEELPPGAWEDHPVRRSAEVVFEREGHGFAGAGEALRIPLPDGLGAPDAPGAVRAALGAIGRAEGAPGPVAFGALPFDRTAPAGLVVPALLLRRWPDGRCTLTSVAPAAGPAPLLPAGGAPGPEPDGFSLRSVLPQARWRSIVEDAVTAIDRGSFGKVVLAREVAVEADRPFVVRRVLDRLRALFPSCTTLHVDGFVGASPELLVRRTGDRVASHPLAGTAARSGDPEADAQAGAALLASAKDREEHAFVVDHLAPVLAERCHELSVPDEPSIVPLRNVLHLGTRIEGRLAEPAPDALELAAALHPTPAVGGWPTEAALAFVAEHEHLDRGRYAGPVGWVDADGDGEWVVGIRCAQVDGRHARMIAGVGVVGGSDPAAELAETQVKLQAMLAALVRP